MDRTFQNSKQQFFKSVFDLSTSRAKNPQDRSLPEADDVKERKLGGIKEEKRKNKVVS